MDVARILLWALLYFTETRGSVFDDPPNACGSAQPLVLKTESGSVSSPGYDEDLLYPANVFCSWTILATAHKHLHLSFETMSIWPTFDCAFDGLVLFDGTSSSAAILGRYCSTAIPSIDIESTGPAIHIVFYSGHVIQRRFRGFKLHFSARDSTPPCKEEELTCINGRCVNRQLICDRKDDCGDGTDEESCGHRVEWSVPCGVTPIPPQLGNDRIVGGREAIPGSWPWQGSIHLRTRRQYGHMCGGVLINDQWMLTAAHCFSNSENVTLWSVHFGKHSKEKADDSERVRYVRKIIIHPKYLGLSNLPETGNRKENDIALVQLNAPIASEHHIAPVCLPPWLSRVSVGTLCHVTGWGATLGTGFSDVLKQAAVPVVSIQSCQSMYQKRFNITKKMICAGFSDGGHDSCKGDSGGPLVVPKHGRWFLVGIVSTGGNCADALQPGIYTRVAAFKWWILSTIWRHNSERDKIILI